METLHSHKTRLIASRPMEYICVFPMEYASGAYIFMAMDSFTDFSIHLGTEKNDSSPMLLKSLKTLMEHEDFVRQRDKGFTIVLPKFEEVIDQASLIISPYQGRLLFNSSLVRSVRVPFAKKLYADITESN